MESVVEGLLEQLIEVNFDLLVSINNLECEKHLKTFSDLDSYRPENAFEFSVYFSVDDDLFEYLLYFIENCEFTTFDEFTVTEDDDGNSELTFVVNIDSPSLYDTRYT